MSGKRCKRLRAAFKLEHKRAPLKAKGRIEIQERRTIRRRIERLFRWTKYTPVTASEWRQVKRAWMRRIV